MRGWIAVNLFLFAMILVGAGLLWLSFLTIRALGLPIEVERLLMVAAAIAAIVGAGWFGKTALAHLEKRSRA